MVGQREEGGTYWRGSGGFLCLFEGRGGGRGGKLEGGSGPISRFLVDCDERMGVGEVEGPLEEGAQALTA